MNNRSPLRWVAIACLVTAACTKLKDPNELIGGDVEKGGQANTIGGAGQSTGGASGGAGLGESGAAASGRSGGGGMASVAGMPDTDCVDEKGFNGLGCYRCEPTDSVTLENACTSAACTPFDRKRLTLVGADGKLPPLPGPSGSGGAGGAGGAASSAGAGGATGTGKACADVAKNGGTLVYITGSSAAGALLGTIAQQLVSQNIYIVYESTGSCVGVDAVLNGTPMTTRGPSAPATSATYWDSASPTLGVACDLPTEGVTADIGASDVFAQSCAGFEFANLDNAGVRDAHGPIQTMTFAVPINSAYTEISAEAAYFVFGFGANGGVKDARGASIWNNEEYLYKRSATSGTQVMLAAAIGVPAGAWQGKPEKGSSDVVAALIAAGQTQETANAALGTLAADYIDTKNLRAQLRMLAFQDTNQQCAVTPDSTVNATDKANVRDGHYPVWGPLHLLLRVDAQGNPLNPANRKAVSDIIGYLSGTKALPNGVQLIDVFAKSGLVPECAMHVSRNKDGGSIVPYHPPAPCSCLFEYKVGLKPECTKCTLQADCAAHETCSLGYCEPE